MLPQMTMYRYTTNSWTHPLTCLPINEQHPLDVVCLQGTPMGAYKGGNHRRDLEISGAVRMIPVFHPCRLIVIHDDL